MNILVINCGSSSLKFQLIDAESEQVIAKGLCERIGIEGSRMVYQKAGGGKQTTEAIMDDHKAAIRMVLFFSFPPLVRIRPVTPFCTSGTGFFPRAGESFVFSSVFAWEMRSTCSSTVGKRVIWK